MYVRAAAVCTTKEKVCDLELKVVVGYTYLLFKECENHYTTETLR